MESKEVMNKLIVTVTTASIIIIKPKGHILQQTINILKYI